MKERSLPFPPALSAKAQGKRPVERKSRFDSTESLPYAPPVQPLRNGLTRATSAHAEEKDVDLRGRFEKDEVRSRSRTRGATVEAATLDASKNSGAQDDMILVMGPTGAGKSRFINKLAQRTEAKEGHSLRSGMLDPWQMNNLRHYAYPI